MNPSSKLTRNCLNSLGLPVSWGYELPELPIRVLTDSITVFNKILFLCNELGHIKALSMVGFKENCIVAGTFQQGVKQSSLNT